VWGLTSDPNATWGSSGTDGYDYGDESAEMLLFDPALWDAENYPELTTLGIGGVL
jgi:hypothetical protein